MYQWNVALKRKSWARFKFYAYARHSLQRYPGCQRLFMRGFRFPLSLLKWPAQKASPFVSSAFTRPLAKDVSACDGRSSSSHARKNVWHLWCCIVSNARKIYVRTWQWKSTSRVAIWNFPRKRRTARSRHRAKQTQVWPFLPRCAKQPNKCTAREKTGWLLLNCGNKHVFFCRRTISELVRRRAGETGLKRHWRKFQYDR